MSEIKEILKKHDIGASIVLHSPGFGETYMKVDPSYSCAFLFEDPGGEQGVRVRTRLQEDYDDGDAAKRNKAQEDTVNMFAIMAEQVGKQALNYMEVMKLLESKFEITHTDGGFTSGNTQSN